MYIYSFLHLYIVCLQYSSHSSAFLPPSVEDPTAHLLHPPLPLTTCTRKHTKRRRKRNKQHFAQPPLFFSRALQDFSTIGFLHFCSQEKSRTHFHNIRKHTPFHYQEFIIIQSRTLFGGFSFFSFSLMNLGSCELLASYWDRWSTKTWLLKKTTPYSQLGFSDFVCRRPTFLNLRIRREWECLSHRALTPVEDEIPSSPDVVEEATQITLATGFHKDLNSLPKPLSATNLSSSFSDGTKVRVAYQGVPGAYSEAAALQAYPDCETVPCDEYEAVFKAVELWLVDKAVLPIENSVGGSIHRNYDLLLRHRLHIVGEVQLIVSHCLLVLPGVRKEELKRVLSHPQALDQCEINLNKLGVTRINAVDSAGAAQMVASEGVRETGAIASARAAEIYGLDILAEGIQDDSDNVTRFLILAREPIIPGTERSHKTSIVFSLEEGPGVLFKALAVFAMRSINLSKIESRPQKRRPLRVVDDSNSGRAIYFDYLFYIDFEASMAEPRAQNALGHLQEFARFIRVLGCYPKDTIL